MVGPLHLLWHGSDTALGLGVLGFRVHPQWFFPTATATSPFLIFEGLHHYLSTVDSDIELKEFNQDLVGFFTSLPTDQIMMAVNQLIDSYANTQVTEFNKIKFTVQLGASEPKLQVFQGTHLSIITGDVVFHSDGKNF